MECASSGVSPEQREQKDEMTALHVVPKAARRAVISSSQSAGLWPAMVCVATSPRSGEAARYPHSQHRHFSKEVSCECTGIIMLLPE